MSTDIEENKWSVYETVKELFSENKSIVSQYIILSLAYPIGEVLLPYYYGRIIERSVKKGKRARLWRDNKSDIQMIIFLWIMKQVMAGALDKLDQDFFPKVEAHLQSTMMRKFFTSYQDAYDDPKTGKIVARMLKLPIIVGDIFHEVRAFIIPAIMTIIGSIGYMFYVNTKLGLFSLVCMFLFGLMIYAFSSNCINAFENMDEESDQLHEEISDILSNMFNVFSSDTISEEMDRLKKYQKRCAREYKKAVKISSKFKLLFNLAYFTYFIAITGYTFHLHSRGEIPLSSLSSVFIIILYVINQLNTVAVELRQIFFDISVVKKTEKAINNLVKPLNGKITKPIILSDGDIKIYNLTVSHEENKVLDIPYLHIEPHETVVLTGKIGSGKSTLVKSILGYYRFEGSIIIDNQNIRDIDSQSIRKQTVFIPQLPRLFNRSLLENIVYGTTADREKVVELLSKTGIGNVFSETELDKNVGKNGEHLSGGQRQIVFFLRAILRNEPLVILDEPTGSLDGNSRDHIIRLLQHLIKDRTAIIITHDPVVMKIATKKIVLENGRLKEKGNISKEAK